MKKVDIWAVVPAAGLGKRMQSATPKQYLELCGRPVIEHTLNRLLAVEQVIGAVVAVQQDDSYWTEVQLSSDKPVLLAPGGEERCHSVINALDVLSKTADYNHATAWALVHDAVRPCVAIEDIENLIDQAAGSEAGGILAVPVRDTMKRQGNDQCIQETVEREGLWHALTPQLFASEKLKEALHKAIDDGYLVTDESSAMEHAGFCPKLVQGADSNIKITRPGDLGLAEMYLNLNAGT